MNAIQKSVLLFVAAACAHGPAKASPLPPEQRAETARSSNEPIRVRVRRIEELEPTSTTAPPPKGALVGERQVLVVLAQTQDARFDAMHDTEYFHERFFGIKHASLRDYYDENSYSLLQLRGKVVGPFDLPGKLDDYGYRMGRSHQKVHELVSTLFAAVSRVVPLGPYDLVNQFGQGGSDGIVDHFVVVYPARVHDPKPGNSFAPIWPHRGTIAAHAGRFRLSSYVIVSHALPLGGLVHEFGHDLGLPDLYDRDDSSHGIGSWCAMASGGWLGKGEIPAHLGAWGKIKLGWIRPQVLSRPQLHVEIPAAHSRPFAIKIPVGGATSKEYFLVENRQQQGYDARLPDTGLLIWHVDETVEHNDNEGHKLVDLEEPNRIQDLDVMLRDQFPDGADTFRAGRRTRFDASTAPDTGSNRGMASSIAITNISTSQGTMTADFTVPRIHVPDGEPFRLAYDNYNYGPFSYVSLGKGAEELVRFDATEGGYLVTAIEALVAGKARARVRVTMRVYLGDEKRPKKRIFEKRMRAEFGNDPYLWLKVPLDRQGLRLRSNEVFWVGLQHHDAHAALSHNPQSASRRSYFRKRPKAGLTAHFNLPSGKTPVPDFVLRVEGLGFINALDADLPESAGADDPLVREMERADRLLDGGNGQAAVAVYRSVLERMEKDSQRFGTWIPVVHNSLGVAAYQAKDYETALEFFRRSLRKAKHAGDLHAEADILHNIGETQFHAGDFDGAYDQCARALTLNARRPGRALENKFWMARAALEEGNRVRADVLFDEAADMLGRAFAADSRALAKWQSRIARARKGERPADGAQQSRIIRERARQRALESAADVAAPSKSPGVNLSDYGIEGEFSIEEDQ